MPINDTFLGPPPPFVADWIKKHTNPYITDGLIAMWDGTWNIGLGTHDEMTTVWRDITGNGYDIPIAGTGLTVQGDCVKWTKPTRTSFSGVRLIFSQLPQNYADANITSEVVMNLRTASGTAWTAGWASQCCFAGGVGP